MTSPATRRTAARHATSSPRKRAFSFVYAVFAVTLAMGSGQSAGRTLTAPLQFDSVFNDAREPDAVHYKATYRLRGAPHQLEVWRDGQRQLKRVTDDAIETFVSREPHSAEYRMVIVDKKHRITTRIDRTNLYRVGNFTDWFDLAHGLKHPKTAYTLTSADMPDGAPAAIAPCRWYRLVQGPQDVRICWSRQSHLPMLVMGRQSDPLWQVTKIGFDRAAPGEFVVHDEGFVRNDANQDIGND